MPNLRLKFAVDLENYELPELDPPKGPLFHRWLPNGEADAIELTVADADMRLKVWFERRGATDTDGFTRFDVSRREVNPEAIARQARLDAGPLFGSVEIKNVDEATIAAVTEDRADDEKYVVLGKRVIRAIVPRITGLIDLLRTNYGQYWLKPLAPWDSRQATLGSFCRSHLQLEWQGDGAEEWKPFTPTAQRISLTVGLVSDEVFERYLSKNDYSVLATQLRGRPELSLAAASLVEAHRTLDSGHLRVAFVEGAIALELAIHEYLRAGIGDSEQLGVAVRPFWRLSRKAQLSSIAARNESIPTEVLEAALKAIDMRNKIVHEGYDPEGGDEANRLCSALLKVAAALLPPPEFRFPGLNTGNKLYGPDP
jgi:hypothetical protein